MRITAAAALLAVAAATAAAPLTAIEVSPGLQHLKIAPAPPVYSPAQLSKALQNILHTLTPPTLGAAVSLTPSAPLVAGLAELDISGAKVISGGMIYGDVPATGAALVNFPPNQPANAFSDYVQIKINARGGQRYAFDCRGDAGAGKAPIQYDVFPSPGPGPETTGSVSIGSDGHFVFVAEARPADGGMIATLTQNTGGKAAYWTLFGCEISPF